MNKQSSHWHKDAKWLAGILALIACSAALLAYSLSWLTGEERAVRIMSVGVATAFSRNGLDDTTEFKTIRAKLKQSGQKNYQPIPALNFYVTEEDFIAAESSPAEARIAFFSRLVEPLYQGGPEGLAALASNDEMRKQLLESAQPLRFITKDTHLLIEKIFFYLAVAAAFLLLLTAFFSRGFGRLISPAIIMLIAAFPGFAITFLFGIQEGPAVMKTPTTEATLGAVTSNMMTVLKPSLKELNGVFGIIMLAGVALLLIACIGKLVTSIARRKKRNKLE